MNMLYQGLLQALSINLAIKPAKRSYYFRPPLSLNALLWPFYSATLYALLSIRFLDLLCVFWYWFLRALNLTKLIFAKVPCPYSSHPISLSPSLLFQRASFISKRLLIECLCCVPKYLSAFHKAISRSPLFLLYSLLFHLQLLHFLFNIFQFYL